ncbi:PAS domain S-box protein [Geminicoccaceae bacterium 1502E]|nr:PAS domain S-box protein [Geminicoccaceae bacterium 1502E]
MTDGGSLLTSAAAGEVTGTIGRWSMNPERTRITLSGDAAMHLLGRRRGSLSLAGFRARLPAGVGEAGLSDLLERRPSLAPHRLVLRDEQGRAAAFAFSVIRDRPHRRGLVERLRDEPAEDAGEPGLRLFVRNLPVAIAMFDTNMRYIVASQRWIEQYGLGGAALAGRSQEELLPQTPGRWRQTLARSLAGATLHGEDELFIRPDGSRERVRWETQPIRGDGGEVTGVLVFSEFVTVRAEAERRLRQSELRLASYLETASDWLWEMDAELRFVSQTPPAACMAVSSRGRTRWEFAGIADPDRNPIWRRHKADLEARRPFRNFTFAWRDATGRLVWLETSGDPQFDESGTFTGYRGTGRDVTRRVEAETRLRRQAEQLEVASDIARMGYWNRDMAAGTVQWSQGLYRIAGLDPADFTPTLANRFDLYHPEDRPSLIDSLETARVTGSEFEARVRVCRPDGSIRHVINRGRFLSTGDDGPEHCFGVLMDVTEQVEARLALDERNRVNAIYRAMIEALPDLVYANDCAGRFLAANQATAQYMGVSAGEELLGRAFADFMTGEDAAQLRGDAGALLEQGDTVIAEQHVRLPDGSRAWFCSLRAPLHDIDGKLIGNVGHSRDITLEKQARAEIERLTREAERAHDILREATAVMDAGFAVFDPKDRLALCNDTFARTYGAPAATLRGMTFAELQALPAFRTALDLRGMSFEAWLEWRLASHCRADGTPFENWVGAEALYVREQRTRSGYSVLLRTNVTDLKRVEAELRSRNEELARLTGELERSKAEAERSRDLLRDATNVMRDGIALFDKDDRLVLCNESYASSFGHSSAGILGRSFVELMRLPAFASRVDTRGMTFEAWLDWRIKMHRQASGVPFEGAIEGEAYYMREQRTADGSTLIVRAQITQLKRVEQELRRLATTDGLTGAGNRRDFTEQGAQFLARARAEGAPAALLLFDIDHFKRINDAFGHEGGDEALRRVSRRCAELLDGRGPFARWGGEEFIMLLPHTGHTEAHIFAERIRSTVAALEIEGATGTFRLTLSLGWAVSQRGEEDLDELIRRADEALYLAKASGRNRVRAAGEGK